MTRKAFGCRNLRRRILTEEVLPALAMLVWILGSFAGLQGVGEAAPQDSSEVYKRVYNGWKWWHVYCARCHGENALGSPLAPNLTAPNHQLTREEFLPLVRDGRVKKGMPAWSQLLDDKQIIDIYVYVMARTQRVLPPGRPDEVGANGGPWTPPQGWPKERMLADVSAFHAEAPKASAVPASPPGASQEASSPGVASDGAAPAAGPTANVLTEAFRSRYQAVRLNLIETAEAMPEQYYDFRLTPAQRPFGGWISHTAMLNYGVCARMGGVPRQETDHLDRLSGKEPLQKALRESFEFCDAALKQMNDQLALTELKIGERTTYPVRAMFGLLSSLNSHYGNLAGYLRSKGIVPPSTARAQARKASSQ